MYTTSFTLEQFQEKKIIIEPSDPRYVIYVDKLYIYSKSLDFSEYVDIQITKIITYLNNFGENLYIPPGEYINSRYFKKGKRIINGACKKIELHFKNTNKFAVTCSLIFETP